MITSKTSVILNQSDGPSQACPRKACTRNHKSERLFVFLFDTDTIIMIQTISISAVSTKFENLVFFRWRPMKEMKDVKCLHVTTNGSAEIEDGIVI